MVSFLNFRPNGSNVPIKNTKALQAKKQVEKQTKKVVENAESSIKQNGAKGIGRVALPVAALVAMANMCIASCGVKADNPMKKPSEENYSVSSSLAGDITYEKLKNRLEELNTSTALNRSGVAGDNQRFGKDGMEDILSYATNEENMEIIWDKLDELEQGKSIWTSDIIKELEVQNSQEGDFAINNSPVREICEEKSINPEVIKLEQKMADMGYSANFADNLETAKVIVKAYETMDEKGFKMPKEVKLMIGAPGVAGFRPYAPQGMEYETPILFSKDLAFIQKDDSALPPMLAEMGIKYNATETPESVVYHEIGHFLHEFSQKEDEEAIKIWEEEANGGYDLELAKEVGYYAMTGDRFNMGREYVAEVFAGLMEGKEYSPKVMDLYYILGGPAPCAD